MPAERNIVDGMDEPEGTPTRSDLLARRAAVDAPPTPAVERAGCHDDVPQGPERVVVVVELPRRIARELAFDADTAGGFELPEYIRLLCSGFVGAMNRKQANRDDHGRAT